MNIGITGQQGFIGRHLKNFLELQDSITIVSFERDYFDDSEKLKGFVKECNVVVHLAALNRHPEEDVIYNTNVKLVKLLINACEAADAHPHILFSSSTQEERDNVYGRSKKEGRSLFEDWAEKNESLTTGMVIPNVFGPFGKPFYNSVVATFCHQVVNGEKPTIVNDGLLKLIYINELVEDIYQLIKDKVSGKVTLAHRHELKVSELLSRLNKYHREYMWDGKIPKIESTLDLALFNTYRCYMPKDYFPRPYISHKDNRGSFVEIIRADTAGQYSFSTTKPGVTRGNHFHTRKVERFAVIKGVAKISLRKIDTDIISEYTIDGNTPAYVDMPIWHTHNITNVGEEELVTLFWINEPYDPNDPDTYYVNV